MITFAELRDMHDRAVGNSRRYYADGRINDLVQAVGEYLAQDDPTVEVAYLRVTLGEVKAEVERLTESNENLRLIANVNGDWNVKFMQEQSRTQDAIARAEAAEQTIQEVSRLAMLDRKCPACSGYDAILGALGGGEQHG